MVEFINGHPTDETGISDGWYFTTHEYGEIYNVPEATVRVWIKRGQIASVDYYGRRYIPVWEQPDYKHPWRKQRIRSKRCVSLNPDLHTNL